MIRQFRWEGASGGLWSNLWLTAGPAVESSLAIWLAPPTAYGGSSHLQIWWMVSMFSVDGSFCNWLLLNRFPWSSFYRFLCINGGPSSMKHVWLFNPCCLDTFFFEANGTTYCVAQIQSKIRQLVPSDAISSFLKEKKKTQQKTPQSVWLPQPC